MGSTGAAADGDASAWASAEDTAAAACRLFFRLLLFRTTRMTTTIRAMRTSPPIVPPTAPPMTAAWAFELLPLLLILLLSTIVVAVCDAEPVRERLGGVRETDGVGDAVLVVEGDALMTVGGAASAKPPGDPGTAAKLANWGVCARDVSALLLDAKAALRLLETPAASPFLGCRGVGRGGKAEWRCWHQNSYVQLSSPARRQL